MQWSSRNSLNNEKIRNIDEEWNVPPIDKENMNFSNLTGSGNDTSTANLNRSDNNWYNPTNAHGCSWNLKNDLGNYKDEEESEETAGYNKDCAFESSRKYNGDAKTSKVCINKLKLTTDSTKTCEDATKLEKLVFGDEGSKKLTKQQTSSELEDTGNEGEKNKAANEESKDNRTSPEQIHIIIDNDCNDIEYNESSVRILHKMISNTLNYYHFNDNYNTDKVMKLFAEHDVIKYSDIATNHSDPKELNSRIDLGEYPISKIYNKKKKNKENDKDKDIESQNHTDKKEVKKQKYSDLMFLPPKPNKYTC